MVRYTYINNLVLDIYRKLGKITFPINPNLILSMIPNCRFMSYQKFARLNNCSLADVIQICESSSGCTHYDLMKDRYLIMCNQSKDENYGRQRWTFFHEVGHIMCKHHSMSAYDKLSENGIFQNINPEYESEADYFAATILSPFPLFQILNIKSPADVQQIFGLSAEASNNRYNQYIKWKSTRIKNAWENDMLRTYRNSLID